MPDQVDELRDACISEEFRRGQQDRNEALLAVLYDLGLRRSELAALDRDHYDATSGTIYLSRAIQKGSPPPATLELGKWGTDASRALDRYLRDREDASRALFPSRQSDRISARTVNNVVEKAARVAGVEPQLANGGTGEPKDVSPHTLRHSVAYRIIQVEGGRLEDVQLRLRHASRRTTDQIYAHLIPR